jgi:hypothetical protein
VDVVNGGLIVSFGKYAQSILTVGEDLDEPGARTKLIVCRGTHDFK